MDAQEFTPEQKQYLQGFLSGANITRSKSSASDLSAVLGLPTPQPNGSAPKSTCDDLNLGPDAPSLLAQNRTLERGETLTEQEAARRAKHPLDQWDDINALANENKFPKGADVLSLKYWGLFYTSPNQNAYMTRLRFPGGIVTAPQLRCAAHVARDYGGGYSHVTTRSNLQMREIGASHAVDVIIDLCEAGVLNKGSGADNIRNITGSPTAGIDAQELYDTRSLTRAMNHYILNHREMYGLPRKFNIAFDGGGIVSTLEDTNDIGFYAVQVLAGHKDEAGQEIEPGIYFRMALGGITGHQDFARDVGILLTPEQCVPMAVAVVRVFIDEGDRTDRKKARLKYVLDRLGLDGFMALTPLYMNFTPRRLPLEQCEPRPAFDRLAHIGVHPQKQDGLFYIGVVLPVGKLEAEQLEGLATLAERYGSGTIRLTPWQNLLISDIENANVESVKNALEDMGLHWSATNVRAGIVACTGNFGCKFALSDTKTTGMEIAAYVEERLTLDTPLNIHITGCPNSCAQHYVGDIGLLGVKVEVEDDMVDGYHIFVGGGFGPQAGIGRLVREEVVSSDAPRVIENMLATYLEERDEGETFLEWTRRHEVEDLSAMFEAHVESNELVAA